METKLSQLKQQAANGDWNAALRIAAKFPRLGKEAAVIKRAYESLSNPSFYTQIGYDVQKLQADGISALKAKYQLD